MLCTYCNIISVYMYVMHVIITNPWNLCLTFYFAGGTCVCSYSGLLCSKCTEEDIEIESMSGFMYAWNVSQIEKRLYFI